MALELWHITIFFGLVLIAWIAFEVWDNDNVYCDVCGKKHDIYESCKEVD